MLSKTCVHGWETARFQVCTFKADNSLLNSSSAQTSLCSLPLNAVLSATTTMSVKMIQLAGSVNGGKGGHLALDASNGPVSAVPLVWKFGGTSIGTADQMLCVADIVRHQSSSTVILLSALSSYKKSEGTTSRLLECCSEVLKPQSTRYLDMVNAIEADHLLVAREAILPSPEKSSTTPLEYKQTILQKCESEIRKKCEKLRCFMAAAEIIDEISPRSKDIIVSTGEKLSAMLFSYILQSQGVNAVYVSIDDIVQERFNPLDLQQSFYDHISFQLSRRLVPILSSSPLVFPIVTGFFGPVPGSLLTSIGRGYTDLAAALVAVGLHAQELIIWKEVDGIFTADPRKVPLARVLDFISPEEAAELTYYGSEVIHPFTMEQVIRAKIPIRIKNAFKPAGNGTLILPNNAPDIAPTSPEYANYRDFSLVKRPTAVTIKTDIVILNVQSNRKAQSHGFLAAIFTLLDRCGVVVDLIATSEVCVSMALSTSALREPTSLASLVGDLERVGHISVARDMCIVSLVGRHMKHLVGMAGKMFDTLARHMVNIEMISQGASEINISCVVSQSSGITALRALHDEVLLGLPPQSNN